MAKCLRNAVTGQLLRTSDDEALRLVREKKGWQYISKDEHKRAVWQQQQEKVAS